MRFAFIARHRGVWQTRQMFQALSVSRAGFYEWLKRPESSRVRENQALLVAIRTSFEQSDRTYGSPRVWRDLQAWGHRCGENRVARLMLAAGLQARRKRRRLPMDEGVRAEHAIAPNLLDRQFEATAPNQRWVADFTYIWTHEGWLYFAVVLDLFSRRIVGWSMSSTMTAQLVTATSRYRRCCMGRPPGWITERTGRAPMRSPGDARARSRCRDLAGRGAKAVRDAIANGNLMRLVPR